MRSGYILFLFSLFMFSANGLGYNVFGGQTDYPVGNQPYGVVAADLDGDGDYDLAVTERGAVAGVDDSVSILMNNGDGTFGEQVKYPCGDLPYEITAADFDGDGDMDLVTANRMGWNISVLLNNGDGSFVESLRYGAGSIPAYIESGDFNRDGYPDLAVGNAFSTELSVLINKRDGTFKTRVNYPVAEVVFGLGIADLDHNGYSDIVVSTPMQIDLMFNDGDGTFTRADSITLHSNFESILVGDFDGDGDSDVAASHQTGHILSFYLNDGTGGFSIGQEYAFSVLAPNAMVGGDFDRDGDIDIACAHNWDGIASVLVNDGAGVMSLEKYYTIVERPNDIAAADFDGDGDDDIAVTTSANTVTIYFGQVYMSTAIFQPDTIVVADAYLDTMQTGIVYVGEFDNGLLIDDLDPFSIRINGSVMPGSYALTSGIPGIDGEALAMYYDLDAVIRHYGAVWDDGAHMCTITGVFIDSARFGAGGDVYLLGLCPGDVNLDGIVSIGDPLYIIGHLYHGGPPPAAEVTADVTDDGGVDMADIVYLVNYIFKHGPAPAGSRL